MVQICLVLTRTDWKPARGEVKSIPLMMSLLATNCLKICAVFPIAATKHEKKPSVQVASLSVSICCDAATVQGPGSAPRHCKQLISNFSVLDVKERDTSTPPTRLNPIVGFNVPTQPSITRDYSAKLLTISLLIYI